MKADAPSCSQLGKGKDKASGGFSAVNRGSGSRGKMKAFESKKEKRRLILSDSDEEKISPRRKSGNACVRGKVKVGDSLEIKEESAINGISSAGAGLENKKRKMDSLRVKEDGKIDRRTKTGILTDRVEEADYLDPYAYRDDDELDRRLIMNSGRDLKKNCTGFVKRSDDAIIDSSKKKMDSLNRKQRKTDISDLALDRPDEETSRKSISDSGSLRKRKLAASFGCREVANVNTRSMKMESGKRKEEKSDVKGSWHLGSRLVSPTSRQSDVEMESGSTSKVKKKGTRNGVPVFERNRKANGSDKKRLRLEKDDDFQSIGVAKGKSDAPCNAATRAQGKNGVLKLSAKDKVKAGQREKREGQEVDEEYINNSRSADVSRKAAVRSSFLGEKKFYQRRGSSAIIMKSYSKKLKVSSVDKKKVDDMKREGSDRTVKLRLKNKDAFSVTTEDSIKQGRRSPLQSPCTTEANDSSQKIGRAEEKQILREKIKDMLANAGWKIDCRPRVSRDYKDFVYIAPSGREYWSIVNAYNEFQRQYLESEEGNDDQDIDKKKSLLPAIPVEALSILKRKPAIEPKKQKLKKNKKKKKKLKCDNGGTKSKIDSKAKLLKNKYIKGKLKHNVLVRDGEILLKKEHNSNSSGSTSMLKEELDSVELEKCSLTSKAYLVHGTNQIRQRGCSLLARSSSEQDVDTDDLAAFAGKRTVLSWLIDSGTVSENGKVQYMNKRRTKAMLKGLITSEGINCGCCSKIVTVSNFEIHAGSKLCQPLQNIFVDSGISLLQCQLDAWNEQEESERIGFHFIDPSGDDPNDDTCGICGDGGDLICCDGCPSTFHLRCLNIEMLPPGDWHCLNCSCKFCGSVCSSLHGESLSLLSCSQCEEKYHQGCMQETDVSAELNGLSMTFCGHSCEKLFTHLRKLLGMRNELEAGFSWTLLQRFDEVSDISSDGVEQKVECNSKLAVALAVMDECFFPIIDRRTGFNLIQHVLYNFGSNFSRLNYSGFYTVILERGDEIISVASIRIHGTRLAEMPFIGTRHMYRRQGMCRRLLAAIESVLCSLNVEKLIIPAISELMHTWTTIFDFKPLEESHRRQMRSLNLVVFPGTDMLQKPLLKSVSTNTKANETAGAAEVERKNPDAPNASCVTSSVGPVINSCDEGEDRTGSAEPHFHTCCDSQSDPSGAPIESSPEVADGTTFSETKPQGKPSESIDVPFVADMSAAHQHNPEEENPSSVVFPGAEAFEVQSNHHDAPEAANVSSSVGSIIHSCNGVEDGVVVAEHELLTCRNVPAGTCDNSVACNLQENGTVCSDSKPEDRSLKGSDEAFIVHRGADHQGNLDEGNTSVVSPVTDMLQDNGTVCSDSKPDDKPLEASDGAFILHKDADHQGNPDEENPSPSVFPVADMLQEPLKKHVSTEGKTDVSVGPVIHSGDEIDVSAAEPDQHACCDSPFGSSVPFIGFHHQANGTEYSDSACYDQSSEAASMTFLTHQCESHEDYPDSENLSAFVPSDEPTIHASGECRVHDAYEGKVDVTKLNFLGKGSRHNSGGTVQSPNAALQAFGERNCHFPSNSILYRNTASLDKLGASGVSIQQHDLGLAGRASECASTSVVSLPSKRDHHGTLKVACKSCISSSAELDITSSSGSQVHAMVIVSEYVVGDCSSHDLDGNFIYLASDEDGESLKTASGINSGSYVKERSSELLGKCRSSSTVSHVTHSDVVDCNALDVAKETPVVSADECNHHNGGTVPYADKIVAKDGSSLPCHFGSSNIFLLSDSNAVPCNTIELVKGALALDAAECLQQEGTLLCSDKMSIEGASFVLDCQVSSEESACCITTGFTADSLEPVSEPKDPSSDHNNVHSDS